MFRPRLRSLSLLILASLAAGTAQAAIVDGQPYVLTAKAGGQVLDNRGQAYTGQMGLWSYVDANVNQEWRATDLGGGRYMFISLASGMALDDGGNPVSGAVATQYDPSRDNLNQQWQVTDVGGGYYRLVNVASGKALDDGGSTTAGDPVRQQDVVSGSARQAWSFTPVQIGAVTPFTTFEAEQGTLLGGASVVAVTGPSTTEFSSAALEASGHAYVHLSAKGQQVSWTNTTGKPMTAINLRYSIPDAAKGGGIDSTVDLYVNGVLRQALPVTSRQTWLYENESDYDSMSQDPSNGHAHVFWDEVHAFVSGAPIQPGDVVTVRKDAANTAAFYDIDLLEMIAPPAPLTRPANSLSITSDCGAVANDRSVDSTAAIQSCLDQAQATGRSVWIPKGTFYLSADQGLRPNGVTLDGAGMWYSTLYFNAPLGAQPKTAAVLDAVSAELRNFAVDGNATSLRQTDGARYGILMKGPNWHIDSLWMQHEGASVWANGDTGLIENTRINNSWADGININNGNTTPGNNVGDNLTVRNNFIRGSGDDGIAINDSGLGAPMQNATVIHNTVVAPWWADNYGVYGGRNDIVANNLALDSVKHHAINVGVYADFGPLNVASIDGNVTIRGGGLGYGLRYPAISLGVPGSNQVVNGVSFRGNTVVDSMFDGMQVKTQTNGLVQYTTMLSTGGDGYVVPSDVQGDAVLMFNHIDHVANGQVPFVNHSPTTFSIDSYGNDGLGIP